MNEKLAKAWDQYQVMMSDAMKTKHPESYSDLFRAVMECICAADFYYGDKPDPKNIKCIDFGDYHGSLLLICPVDTYQPSKFYCAVVAYGSCGGCDTLLAVRDLDNGEVPSTRQIDQYMSLALHLVQSIKEIGSEND